MDVKLSRQVKMTTQRLLKWIDEHNIAVHEKIPNMAKLSKEFGVSVTTVHSAVRHLARQGILDSGVGSGTFLARPIDKIDNFGTEKHYTVGLVLKENLAENLESGRLFETWKERWSQRIIDGIYKASRKYNIRIKPIGVPLDIWFNPTSSRVHESVKDKLKGIDGVISFPLKNRILIDVFEKSGLPWVLINPPGDLSTTNYVSPDYYGASVIVGRLASRLGARHIWVLTPLPNWPSNYQRICGIRDGIMFERGIFNGVIIVTAQNVCYEEGMLRLSEAFDRYDHKPDFIYTSGDFLAEAAVDFVRKFGIVPGKDVSIISSTGLPEIADYTSPISCVKLPMAETGSSALEMIRRMLKINQYTLPAKIIPAPIVLRDTTPKRAEEFLKDIESERSSQYETDMIVI